MTSLSTFTETRNYFEEFLNRIGNEKIISFFSFGLSSFSNHNRYRSYCLDGDLYIMFESKKCLIISYLEIDSLEVDFRELTEEEVKEYEKLTNEDYFISDFFNDVTCIYDSVTRTKRHSEISLEYGRIEKIKLSPVTSEYWKWEKGDIMKFFATEETFNDITIIMDNGKSIVVHAGDEIDDGACWVYSEDAI